MQATSQDTDSQTAETQQLNWTRSGFRNSEGCKVRKFIRVDSLGDNA